ncbi:MAG: glycosyltransferase [Solirubrobacteraceae bacterium]
MTSGTTRLMITAFGWDDPGGGTTVPRLAAKELVRRGWDVTVFHAAVPPTPSGRPYETREWEQDGVRLIGIHNRPSTLFDMTNPARELDDPIITRLFADALERVRPSAVHFHNLHNLGAALIDQAALRGLPAFFTTHNYWLICPRAYLLNGAGEICSGPADGARCAACVDSADISAYQLRLAYIRARAESGLTRILAVSDAVRHALLGAGYPWEAIDVVRQTMPHEQHIWQEVGRHRVPGRRTERLRVAFLGSAYPHKGPQLLVQAAQRTKATLDVRIIGEIHDRFADHLRAMDTRGVVSFHGPFTPAEIGGLLSDVDVAVLPSMWWDCAPLAGAECLAAKVPLVVPRLGGLPEAIQNEVDGLVFDALDPASLAAALDRLASEPGLLEQLQSNIQPPRAFAEYVDELERYYMADGEPPIEPNPGASTAATSFTSSLAVTWQGDVGLPSSLSIINDEITAHLGLTVTRLHSDGTLASGTPPHPANVEVRHQWPPDFSVPASGALATILPWEFGSIPVKWRDQIGQTVDEVWVPSQYVRTMFIDSGVAPDSVRVILNGVDLNRFRPAARPEDGRSPVRFLFVGGANVRKGIDILLAAWDEAFPDRSDVRLTIKAALAAGAYPGPGKDLISRSQDDLRPPVDLITEDLDAEGLADLYRACDVMVLPYRGEGFAMPALEAMACGLPLVHTAGGPTEEFCPPAAGWTIRSARRPMSPDLLPGFETVNPPWMLEPDRKHLVEVLREVAENRPARLAKGAAARQAAERLSWEAVAASYRDRITFLAQRPPKRATLMAAFPFAEPASLRVLATPAWLGQDRLAELLTDWSCLPARADAYLHLLADANLDAAALEHHVLQAAAAASVDLDTCADVDILVSAFRPDRDRAIHQGTDIYVPLHPGCVGHSRLARQAGSRVLAVGSAELRATLERWAAVS